MSETWRDIPNFEGRYQASDKGRIRSLPRRDRRGCWIEGRNLQLTPLRNRYFGVKLSKDNLKRTYHVHRLVAWAFLGAQPIGFVVNHIDCDKTNNRIENLEYCTPQENTMHAMKHRLIRYGEGVPTAKLKEVQVLEVLRLAKQGMRQAAIAALTGINPRTVSSITSGQTWKHLQSK